MRFHGPIKRYRGEYTNRQLAYYARKMLASDAKSAWVYFNNTDDCNAYKDAKKLQKIVAKL